MTTSGCVPYAMGVGRIGRGLAALWNRFHIWRAMRLYRSVLRHEEEARADMAEADRLMVKHAEPPQPRLPLGDD